MCVRGGKGSLLWAAARPLCEAKRKEWRDPSFAGVGDRGRRMARQRPGGGACERVPRGRTGFPKYVGLEWCAAS